jgi:adenine-specific DNA-methyltransferase
LSVNQAFSTYIKEIPIPPASERDKGAIETLVQKCLDAKGENCQQWEAEIDDIVARIYGLTEAERVIIEGKS